MKWVEGCVLLPGLVYQWCPCVLLCPLLAHGQDSPGWTWKACKSNTVWYWNLKVNHSYSDHKLSLHEASVIFKPTCFLQHCPPWSYFQASDMMRIQPLSSYDISCPRISKGWFSRYGCILVLLTREVNRNILLIHLFKNAVQVQGILCVIIIPFQHLY
jgi:hypothetical protein